MSSSKTVKLLLSNGKLTGIIRATLSNWEGILFSSPRKSYLELAKHKETKEWGIYILLSNSEVYIGQSRELLRRIGEHDQNKEWWDRVILLTTAANSLTRSDVDYLENKLIHEVVLSNLLKTNNVQSGNVAKVDIYRESELQDFIAGTKILLEIIGVKIFANDEEKISESARPNPVSTETGAGNAPKAINNKSSAIDLLKNEHNIAFNSSAITYAKLQSKSGVFWLNPRVNFLNEEWYLILNDQVKKQIILICVPSNTYSVKEGSNGDLIVRKDKKQYIDLNIKCSDYTDARTKVSFKKHIIKVVNY